MTITALPDPPSRSDAPATFVAKADAFIAALPGFVSETNATAAAADADAAAAAASEAAALASENNAAASEATAMAGANFKGNWSDLVGALNVPASVRHDDAYWALTTNLADVTAKTPGIDPEWVEIETSSAADAIAQFNLFGGF